MDRQAGATFDSAVCRWGYMFAADPEAALRETRRVLKPGGRLALAAWDEPQHNAWVSEPGRELAERLLAEPPPSVDAPGIFALSRPGRLEELLGSTGFQEVEVETIEVQWRWPNEETWFTALRELSTPYADAVSILSEPELDELRATTAQRLVPGHQPEAELVLTGRALVAAGTA